MEKLGIVRSFGPKRKCPQSNTLMGVGSIAWGNLQRSRAQPLNVSELICLLKLNGD